MAGCEVDTSLYDRLRVEAYEVVLQMHPTLALAEKKAKAEEIFQTRWYKPDMRSVELEESETPLIVGPEFTLTSEGEIYYPQAHRTLEELYDRQHLYKPSEYSAREHATARLVQKALNNGATEVSHVSYYRDKTGMEQIRDFVTMKINTVHNKGAMYIQKITQDGHLFRMDEARAAMAKRYSDRIQIAPANGVFIFADKPMSEHIARDIYRDTVIMREYHQKPLYHDTEVSLKEIPEYELSNAVPVISGQHGHERGILIQKIRMRHISKTRDMTHPSFRVDHDAFHHSHTVHTKHRMVIPYYLHRLFTVNSEKQETHHDIFQQQKPVNVSKKRSYVPFKSREIRHVDTQRDGLIPKLDIVFVRQPEREPKEQQASRVYGTIHIRRRQEGIFNGRRDVPKLEMNRVHKIQTTHTTHILYCQNQESVRDRQKRKQPMEKHHEYMVAKRKENSFSRIKNKLVSVSLRLWNEQGRSIKHQSKDVYKKSRVRTQTEKEHFPNRREKHHALAGFVISRFLWRYMRTDMESSLKTKIHEKHFTIKKQEYVSSWILLSIIWYLTMLREGGIGTSWLTATNKMKHQKRKKKKIHRRKGKIQHYLAIPSNGVIFLSA